MEIHPTTPNMRRFLPADLQWAIWSDIEDPTAMEVGDWLFDPAKHAHYAGKILENNHQTGMMKVEWHKDVGNVFTDLITWDRLTRYWWRDPMEN